MSKSLIIWFSKIDIEEVSIPSLTALVLKALDVDRRDIANRFCTPDILQLLSNDELDSILEKATEKKIVIWLRESTRWVTSDDRMAKWSSPRVLFFKSGKDSGAPCPAIIQHTDEQIVEFLEWIIDDPFG